MNKAEYKLLREIQQNEKHQKNCVKVTVLSAGFYAIKLVTNSGKLAYHKLVKE